MARKSRKIKEEPMPPESDETFAYIAGYTSGGFPYGVTWEEYEQEVQDNKVPETLPPQKSPVSLEELAQEMQLVSGSITIYFRRSTGEFFRINEDYENYGDSDWELDEIGVAEDVLAHLHEGDFVALPSQEELGRYWMMESFCHTIDNEKISKDLIRAISGRGAFRRFKEAIRRHSVQELWYRFQNDAYREHGREWCEENNLEWTEVAEEHA